MTTALTAALIIGILALALIAAGTDQRHGATSRAAKMIAASGVLVLAAVVVPELSAYVMFVLAALVFSWVGDLALSYPGKRAFVVGLVAFAAAHIAYIAAFISRGGLSPWLLGVAGLAMIVFSIIVLHWLAPHRPATLRWPIVFYVVVIGIMVATAFATLGNDPNALIPTAAILFAASDLFVARQRFVTESRWNRIIGLPLYFVAQILFVLSTI